MTETWIVLGASSSMARAFTRKLAERGDGVILAGRTPADLERDAADARVRGAALAETVAFDARDPASFGPILDRLEGLEGTVSAAVFVGSMPPQAEIDADPSLIAGVVTDSFTGPAQFLHRLAPLMESRGSGTVVGITSVAGDRGRIGNYAYGAAKAGFGTYLSGLRNRLTRAGGHVVTVKPGFTDTAMTWGIEGMFLVAPPETVAADILKAVEKKRNVIYTPLFWTAIMGIIRAIPEPIFKKMSI
ncbi:SDR family NAD(P)-dependent oxidoreductase [Rhodovulum adriaticum]|uniref:Short-subunit dehydrogenase n=1 Tax=Rhodovulum adriaticum TaxID=35804 RepID=A0A4R2NMA3_RHOAD|nr:SDR family NAD(P)-dependent oxidoreductase [Rhodovulum adriaticum]MBK1637136.1 short-chain dehydrogenase [Rhodovulum adriaticum]TCP22730.1 short-subunit dehydrogenase [Rhodovulum adriaticum]